MFRLARQERDVWVTWPARVAALMAAQIMAEVERQSGASVTIETAIMQRVLEAHVREQLDALADLDATAAPLEPGDVSDTYRALALQFSLRGAQGNRIAGENLLVDLGLVIGGLFGRKTDVGVLLRHGLKRRGILLGQALRQAGEHHEQKGDERNRAADEREAAARCGDFSDC